MEALQSETSGRQSTADRTPIGEVMTTNVVCATDGMDLDELRRLFVERGISGAPVVDSTGRVAGVVSKTDLVRRHYEGPEEAYEGSDLLRLYHVGGSQCDLGPGFHEVPLARETVRDIMTPIAYTLKVTTSIAQAAALMAFEGVHRVPIVSDGPDGEVVGLLSALDVLRWLGEQNGYLPHHGNRPIPHG